MRNIKTVRSLKKRLHGTEDQIINVTQEICTTVQTTHTVFETEATSFKKYATGIEQKLSKYGRFENHFHLKSRKTIEHRKVDNAQVVTLQ